MKSEEQYIIESRNIKIWQLEQKIDEMEKQYQCIVDAITPWLTSSVGNQLDKEICFDCLDKKGNYDEN